MSPSMQRCAVIAPYATQGGVTSAFFTSLELVRRAGFEPVAVADRDALFLHRLKDTGDAFHVLPRLAAGGRLAGGIAGWRLGRLLRRLQPALVLAHNGRFVGALKRWCPGLPVVGVVHAGKPGRFLPADRLITVNHNQRAALLALGYEARRVVQIDNVLPVDAVPPFVGRPWHEPPAIGTLRILEHAKGVDVLIAAAALLKAQGQAFKLHVGGTGSEEGRLKAEVKRLGLDDHVRFHGWVSPQQPFLESIDVYVLPSRHETFGIAILEAQAAGLPVISSRCEGPEAIIRDKETGILVEPDNPAALAAAIGSVLENREMAAALARAGHDQCGRDFVLPAISGAYGSVLHAALNEG